MEATVCQAWRWITLDILKNKLSGLKIVFPLKQIGQNWVSEFEDSEGNHIELTAPYRKE